MKPSKSINGAFGAAGNFDASCSSSISTLKHLSIFIVIRLTKISEENFVFRVANANANAAPQLK